MLETSPKITSTVAGRLIVPLLILLVVHIHTLSWQMNSFWSSNEDGRKQPILHDKWAGARRHWQTFSDRREKKTRETKDQHAHEPSEVWPNSSGSSPVRSYSRCPSRVQSSFQGFRTSVMCLHVGPDWTCTWALLRKVQVRQDGDSIIDSLNHRLARPLLSLGWMGMPIPIAMGARPKYPKSRISIRVAWGHRCDLWKLK